MSTVLRPADARAGDAVSAPAAPSHTVPPRPRPGARASADGLRFAAFAGLVLYGCEHWARQVAPTAGGPALQMTAVAVLVAALLALGGEVAPARRRRLLAGAVVLLGALAGLAAAGIPVRYLGWHHWAAFADGVGEGLSSLPNLNVPYRGLEPWVRWTILSGAGLLGVLAAALAWGGRRAPGVRGDGRRQVAAAVTLGVLYGVPVVERNPESPWVSGAGFAVLLALFLGADRLVALRGLRPRAIAAAGALVALGLATLVAPRLDGATPWVDYRGLADDLAHRNQTSFNWNHSYSPLTWPRDGREVLRVRAKEPSYWKAAVLRRFDGLRWEQQEPYDTGAVDTPRPTGEPGWYEDVRVTVRNMRSDQYIGAGFTNAIRDVGSPAEAAGSGTWVPSTRALRPGDTYTASVYTPRPTRAQLLAAGTQYPDYVAPDLTMELPQAVGGPPGIPANGFRPAEVATAIFPAFDTPGPVTVRLPGRATPIPGGEQLLETSRYKRTWALAQELRARASSPFDLVRRVRRRVQQGARYTERPAQRAVPLDAFLFDTHEGYCQQFSGAMALLLRMAGVPARVASGFTPGSYNADRGQYVVRDLAAHSWGEAFFPGIGWVTLDPTPTIAPPAAQETGDGGDAATAADTATRPRTSDGADAATASSADAPSATSGGGGEGGTPVLLVVLGIGAVGLAAGGAWWWRRPHGRLAPLEELRRALARSGRPAAPELTLAGLERRLAGSPAAQAYVRKLRLGRYAGSSEPPSPAERAALREELGAGLGLRGRLRAWWALPPQRPARR